MSGKPNVSKVGGKPQDELDRSFRAALVAYFTKRVKDAGEAEDLTQEVLFRLANHPDRNNGETIKAYVFTIAANLLRDRLKSAGRARQRQSQSFEQLQENFAETPELTEGRTPERVLMGKETLRDVLRVLSELGERTSDIFILARLENMQHREIAALHGISISAVEKHIMKATAHLGARFLRK